MTSASDLVVKALNAIRATPTSYAILDLDVAVFSQRGKPDGMREATQKLLEVFCAPNYPLELKRIAGILLQDILRAGYGQDLPQSVSRLNEVKRLLVVFRSDDGV